MKYYIPVKRTQHGRMIVEAETPQEALKTFNEEGAEWDEEYDENHSMEFEWYLDEEEVIIDEEDKEYPIKRLLRRKKMEIQKKN